MTSGTAPATTGAAAGVERGEQLDRLRWRYFVSVCSPQNLQLHCKLLTQHSFIAGGLGGFGAAPASTGAAAGDER